MRTIIIVVAAGGIAAGVALGARGHLPRAADTEVAPARAVVRPAAPAAPRMGAAAERPATSVGPDAATRGGPSSAGEGVAGAGAGRPRAPRGADPTASPEAVAPAVEPVRPAAQATAESVLRHASAAYRRVRSLRADFVQRIENPLLGSTTTSRGTLFERRPDRLLLRFSEPAGDVIVGDGRFFWVYYPSVDPKQVIRAPASAGGAGGVDLQAQFLGDPVARFDATLEGRQTVAGRPAYVVRMVPKKPTGYRSLKVWIDARDWLARRFEIAGENGSLRRFELSDLRTDVPLKDALFRFTPPPGAQVIDRH